MKITIIVFLLSSNALLFGQQISGTVFEMDGETPVEFVNIGVVGKNVGTVSDRNGNYELLIPAEFHDNTLRFSSIGYHPYSVKVSDFLKLNDGNVRLEQQVYDMAEVVVRPRRFRERTLGITTRNPMVSVSWTISSGGEMGILMKNSKIAFLKEVNINVMISPYDTIFCRLNIYKAHKNRQFENILTNPIYFNFSKEEIKDRITIDLRHLNLVVAGDFLVTFEFVEMKSSSGRQIFFPASLFSRSYYRKTSQGEWTTPVAAISLSVLVDAER